MHDPGQGGSAASDMMLFTDTNTNNTYPRSVCTPCCHLTKDTQVSTAIPPDYSAASFLCDAPDFVPMTQAQNNCFFSVRY